MVSVHSLTHLTLFPFKISALQCAREGSETAAGVRLLFKCVCTLTTALYKKHKRLRWFGTRHETGSPVKGLSDAQTPFPFYVLTHRETKNLPNATQYMI